MCSNGVTSATICTPAAAKSGRPAGKRSSTIHCVNGSVTTGHASLMPSAVETSDRSRSVVSGTIRSTMVEGKATSASIHLARLRDRKAANCVTIRPMVWPLAERLSHDRTVKGAAPPIRSATRKEVVDHHRLVRPVEGTDSEMDDARRDARAVIGRTPDLAGKSVELGVGQAKIAVFRAGNVIFRRFA